MKVSDLILLFERLGEDHNIFQFDKIDNPPSKRLDLCAFLLLDRLVPWKGGINKIVLAAGINQIWIRVDLEALAAVATEHDVVCLLRCGVFIDAENDSLSMHV